MYIYLYNLNKYIYIYMDILRRQMNRLVYTGKFQRLEAVALKLFLAEFSNHGLGVIVQWLIPGLVNYITVCDIEAMAQSK